MRVIRCLHAHGGRREAAPERRQRMLPSWMRKCARRLPVSRLQRRQRTRRQSPHERCPAARVEPLRCATRWPQSFAFWALHRPCSPGLPPRLSIRSTWCARLPARILPRRFRSCVTRHGRASGRAGHHQLHPLADHTRSPASVRHGPARLRARPDRHAAGRLDAARRAACALRRCRARHRLRHRLSRHPE